MNEIIEIIHLLIKSFNDIWIYFIITIPIAVTVQLTGAARYINMVFNKNIHVAILLATILGAFSPFCSCGVIPVITTLLIGGVPIAPVMSFWIASPSMDPEIFFLSTATIGWRLSVWRLASTFILSLIAGYSTYFLFKKGWLGKEILNIDRTSSRSISFKSIWLWIIKTIKQVMSGRRQQVNLQLQSVNQSFSSSGISCCVTVDDLSDYKELASSDHDESCIECSSKDNMNVSFIRKLLEETWKASWMVFKFMLLAFLINVFLQKYVSIEFLSRMMGAGDSYSVLMATLIGIPVYTSNITALPILSGLLAVGMNEGAALAFLISGPVTTLPAMIAVWYIVNRRIFYLYLSYALLGAFIFGSLFNILNG